MTEGPRVTVVGGGIAGLTAALRLAQRGYQVKVYEKQPVLGGDLGSRPVGAGVEIDVYPHMYLSWYRNFWRLMHDVTGLERSQRFVPFSSIKQLRRGEFPSFTGLTNLYSVWHLLPNLFSGVGPPADMFVYGYAAIDLLAERLNPTVLLDDMSMTGFLHSRPYMTDRAAAAFDSFITLVWSIPSHRVSAEDFRTYMTYSFADHTPAFWLASGSAQQEVIAPLTDALEDEDVEIVRSVVATRVSCRDGRVTEIELQDTCVDEESLRCVSAGETWTEVVDELVLAVPPDILSSLVRTGDPGHRVTEAAPKLVELARLHTERIPIIYLYFKRKLKRIPPEPVGLFDSPLALAFTDISQTWADGTGSPNTVLAVSASDPYALPDTGPEDDAFAMLRELAEYLDVFEPGTKWGESGEIDWERTSYHPNIDAKLFVNETGTATWRPRAACDGVSNLVFAGDFCANSIGMMTIESAVVSGLEAARAVVERHGVGAPVEILEPEPGMPAAYVWLRYAWAPYAAAASAWSTLSDGAGSLMKFLTPASRRDGQRRES